MYLEKVNMMTLCEIFQLGAYDDDIHRLSVQSETGWHLKSNDSPSQLIPIQKTKIQWTNSGENTTESLALYTKENWGENTFSPKLLA